MENTGYYYAEVARGGKRWWRMTPNGDWMPKPETVERKYDRAGIAAMAMAGFLHGKDASELNIRECENTVSLSVSLTDQLIAELKRTEK